MKCPRRSVFSRRLSSTARASSNRSMTAWLSLPRLRFGPGVADPVARSRSVVGHMQIVVSCSSACRPRSGGWRGRRWSSARARRARPAVGRASGPRRRDTPRSPRAARRRGSAAACPRPTRRRGPSAARDGADGVDRGADLRAADLRRPAPPRRTASPSLKRACAPLTGSSNPPAT